MKKLAYLISSAVVMLFSVGSTSAQNTLDFSFPENTIWVSDTYLRTLTKTKSLALALESVNDTMSMIQFNGKNSVENLIHYFAMHEGIRSTIRSIDSSVKSQYGNLFQVEYNGKTVTDSNYYYRYGKDINELVVTIRFVEGKNVIFKQHQYTKVGAMKANVSAFDSLINDIVVAGRYVNAKDKRTQSLERMFAFAFRNDGTCVFKGNPGMYELLPDQNYAGLDILRISYSGTIEYYAIKHNAKGITLQLLTLKNDKLIALPTALIQLKKL
ncbi:MAG: hypothetical protein U0Y96_13775 [Candidatus Kapaibacterium sp.]|nr:hypothetical protein [Bacteroidota bacterium]